MTFSLRTAPPARAHALKLYAVAIGALAIVLWLFPLEAGSFGTIDYMQYWSAWRLLVNGQNPYDPFLLHDTQVALSSASSSLIYSWNPPWTYTLLAPFLIPPFIAGATLWLLFQIAALLFIARNAPRALRIRELRLHHGIFVIFFFLPSLYALHYGQLGILFALSFTCFPLALNGKKYAVAGASLLPLTLKPHIFFLCVIPGVLWLSRLPRGERRRFMWGSVGGFTILVGLTLAIQPSSLTWWFDAMIAPPPAHPRLIHFHQWMTHTATTAIRLLLVTMYGVNPTWPLLAVPAGTFVLTLLYFWVRRPAIDWPSLLPPMICLCLATSSYAWVYDQVALALCQYVVATQARACKSRAAAYGIVLGCFATQVVPLILISMNHSASYLFFLMPWALLGLLLISRRSNQISER